MKKTIITLLAIMLAAQAWASYGFAVKCSTGQKLYYFIEDSNSVSVYSPHSDADVYYGAIIIPEYVTYKKVTYKVTGISGGAFRGCNKLTSVFIPNTVTYISGRNTFEGCNNLNFNEFDNAYYIGNSNNPYYVLVKAKSKDITTCVINPNCKCIHSDAFAYCRNLTSIKIPQSVTNIEWGAFQSSGLKRVVIPNSVNRIGGYAFYCGLAEAYIPSSVKYIGCEAFNGCKMIMVAAKDKPKGWDIDWRGHFSWERGQVHWGEVVCFSDYAINKVSTELNEWQKKGEFEKVADWHQRVNNETRNKKIKELTIKAEKEYIEKYADKHTPYVLGTYDTENEVFLVSNAKYGKMLVPVPFDKAPVFRQQWEQTIKDTKYLIDNDVISIANIVFTLPNGEQYTYNSKASLNYEVAQMNYNFAPIEIAAPTSESKGNQTITTTQRTIGVSDIDTNLPISNEKQDNTFAVIIANENYQKEAQVPFATNDGRTFAEYCKKTMGIPDNNIHIATDATLNNMKYEINWLKQVIEAYNGNARAIFYYAGHGIPDESAKTAYLLPVDGFGNDVSTGYKLDDLYSTLGNLPSKSVTVFLDACFSGANRSGEMLASARGVAIKAKNSAPVGNMVVFSAAQGDETAYPNNEQQHGMFTYYLLKKIKETAGNVTYKELGDYVTDNVRKQSIVVNGKSQTPTVVPSATVGGTWETWKLK